jgi:hypothetical protein
MVNLSILVKIATAEKEMSWAYFREYIRFFFITFLHQLHYYKTHSFKIVVREEIVYLLFLPLASFSASTFFTIFASSIRNALRILCLTQPAQLRPP